MLRAMVRDSLVGVGILLLAPLWMLARLDQSDHFFAACSELLSLIPGKLGIYIRRSFYRMTLDRCAPDVHIGFGTTIAHSNARIGHGVYIGNRCTLGMCDIGDHATLGSNVDLLSGRRQHRFDQADVPVQEQGGVFISVCIGRNTWIGNSAVVMANVGANAIVGAGSVVVHTVPASALVAGNPAQVKRMRNQSCHSERSEKSPEILRCAQNDNPGREVA
jgi:virginiamycin A acetyltransferase